MAAMGKEAIVVRDSPASPHRLGGVWASRHAWSRKVWRALVHRPRDGAGLQPPHGPAQLTDLVGLDVRPSAQISASLAGRTTTAGRAETRKEGNWGRRVARVYKGRKPRRAFGRQQQQTYSGER